MSELSDAFAPLVETERQGTPPRGELQRRAARHRRKRRALGAGALLVVIGVIAGVATLAPTRKESVQIRNPPTTTTIPRHSGATVTAVGWRVTVPKGWHAIRSSSVCNENEPGIIVSPDPHAFSSVEGAAGCFTGSNVAVPHVLVAVAISRNAPSPSITRATLNTTLPLSLADVPADSTERAFHFTGVIENGASYNVRVVLAPGASAATRRQVNATLQSLRPDPLPPPFGAADAVDVGLPDVTGIAFDSGGNLYLADDALNRVLMVKAGAVVRVIGNGTQGFSGDGGQAANAQLYSPRGVAVDDHDNLYIADSFNNRIRRVTPDGIITTYAGTGALASGPDGLPAVHTALFQPDDIVWDSTTASLYVAEGSRVRRIGADGIVHTVAGNDGRGSTYQQEPGALATATGICSPSGIALSTDHSLWIANDCDKSIARVAPDGRIRPAPGHAFRLAAAPDGSVSAYFGRSPFIDRVTPTTDTTIIALESKRAPTASCAHYGGQGSDFAALAWRGRTLYFANPSMGRVCALQPDGKIDTIVGG